MHIIPIHVSIHPQGWWSWQYLWTFLNFAIPTAISGAALIYVLYDRRAHLQLAQKRGEWCVLRRTIGPNEMLFQGVVEVYNLSSRSNAIRDYKFLFKAPDGDWRPMESEQYDNSQPSKDKPDVYNETALTLAPYSGKELKVQAIIAIKPHPFKAIVRVEIEDLFGKRYGLNVNAETT